MKQKILPIEDSMKISDCNLLSGDTKSILFEIGICTVGELRNASMYELERMLAADQLLERRFSVQCYRVRSRRPLTDDMRIDECPYLSVRAINALDRYGSGRIHTIGELRKASCTELLKLKNFGAKCLRECQFVLKHGRAPTAKELELKPSDKSASYIKIINQWRISPKIKEKIIRLFSKK